MGRKSQRKGYRIENEIVNLHREMGIEAQRVPLSGAAGGRFAGDIVGIGPFQAEVKARGGGEGFKLLERWLEKNDILFLRKDGSKCPIVVMEWRVYECFVRAYCMNFNTEKHHDREP